MANPKVIIADEDVNYIIPLQFKFVTEFFNKIDLEIISDKEYFDEYFKDPRTAEVLVISEELYGSAIQKHNIQNIFVMTEQSEGNDSSIGNDNHGGNNRLESEHKPPKGDMLTGELNVTKLFKYSSIREIFNEIVGKSASALNIVKSEKKETKIVAVASAYGGAGKTFVSRNVAMCLSKNYKRVLYINNGSLQSFQYEFNNKSKLVISDIKSLIYEENKNLYREMKHLLRNEGFAYLPAFKNSLMTIGLSKEFFYDFCKFAKKSNDFDYIIVDLENVYDESMINFFDLADKVFVITEQKSSNLEATNDFVVNTNISETDKYIFVCNKFDEEKRNDLINPSQKNMFSVNEYVDMLDENVVDNIEETSKNMGIRKISFLIM